MHVISFLHCLRCNKHKHNHKHHHKQIQYSQWRICRNNRLGKFNSTTFASSFLWGTFLSSSAIRRPIVRTLGKSTTAHQKAPRRVLIISTSSSTEQQRSGVGASDDSACAHDLCVHCVDFAGTLKLYQKRLSGNSGALVSIERRGFAQYPNECC